MKPLFFLIFVLFSFIACQNDSPQHLQTASGISNDSIPTLEPLSKWERYFQENPAYLCDGFDYPVGPPDGKGYYNAQAFQVNNHLGDDWNATTGGNSDLGDPIHAIGNGYVVFAKDISGGWGRVMRVMHKLDDSTYIESIYAHCDSFIVAANEGIKRGQKIATIGDANGAYWAHLHLEIRDSVEMDIGGGYSSYYNGWLDPTKFIKANRPKK